MHSASGVGENVMKLKKFLAVSQGQFGCGYRTDSIDARMHGKFFSPI
jgi:hypothetical protein